jgi:polyisoprenoid-binding protein YceI
MAGANDTYTLGPADATLTVHTGKTGAAAKAGHDLTIEVTSWEAALRLGAEPTLALTADPRSLRVLDGHGGMQSLGDDDKDNIAKSIDGEVLKGTPIAFRSTSVTPAADGRVAVAGELELWGVRRPLSFDLAVGADGALSGRAVVTQTAFGVKPYSTLFGTLKVADDVEVRIDGRLPTPAPAT